MSGGGNEGSGSNWGSRFLKGASVVAASAAVAGGLYALLSSSTSANSELEAPFGARREHKEDDDDGPFKPSGPSLPGGSSSPGGPFLHGGPFSPHPEASSQVKVWKKPEIGCVKLNVDGSREHHGLSPSAGCGGVFRDASGRWLFGFALKLDPKDYEVQDTELKAILEGMQLASKMKFETSEMKFEKLIVESDNEDVVRMVEEDTLKYKKHRREYGVVQSIRELRFDPKWQVKLVYIHRDANGVANRLARKACTLSSDGLREYRPPLDWDIESFHLKDIGQDRV